jgi:hypothetical protein
MKKLLTSIIVMLAVGTTTAFSQVKWNVEAQAGIAAMTSLPMDNGCRFQWSLGGGASIPLSRLVHIAPSLLLSQRGATVDGYYGNEMIIPATFSIRTDYLELPLYLALHLGSNEHLRFIIKTGPSFGYGLTGKVKVSSQNGDFSTTYPENLFSQPCSMDVAAQSASKDALAFSKFNRFDLMWASGFDIMFQQHFIVGVNVKFGLTDVTSEPTESNIFGQFVSVLLSGTANSRNVSFSLSAAYQF